MKYLIITFLIIVTVLNTCQAQNSNIYNFTAFGINGQQYSLNNYQGLKLIFVILPVLQTDSNHAYLNRIDSIARLHLADAKVIVFPSYDDGFVTDSSNSIINWYSSLLDSSIILSQPAYTHKASGTNQDLIFNWLTDVTKNEHFNEDIEGPGQMFFVNESGVLYGVFGPGAMWSNKVLDIMFQ